MNMASAGSGIRPTVAGLFAGVGGIELGFKNAGFESALLCENDPAANAVLDHHFPGVPRHDDVATLDELPPVDVLAGGFPCQDLSQAGRTAGIKGSRSGLVGHVFNLIDRATDPPKWIVLENVSFMLRLDRGEAMTYLTRELGRRGYVWAYRIVDTQAFGLPQRRQRVILVASREGDPRWALLNEDAGPVERSYDDAEACGFYWTEGLRGLGWALDAVPTLKGGSGLGIPSPPAYWLRETGEICTPEIRDAERLQGLEPGWTEPALEASARNQRWKLVGNAVSVPVAGWLAERLLETEEWDGQGEPHDRSGSWPAAGWGSGDEAFRVDCSAWPVAAPFQPLNDFLEYERVPLSPRATAGFLSRTKRARLRFEPEFIAAVENHLRVSSQPLAA